jgi:hypothetical protein
MIRSSRLVRTIGLGLVSGCDLKRECFAVLERRPAIEPEAGNSYSCHFSIAASFENQTEVVGRHRDSLGQYESGASGNI